MVSHFKTFTIVCQIFLHTDGMDYILSNIERLIFTTVETQCINVSLVDDTTVEDQENISIMLSTMEERVILDPLSAEIIIMDNDSKQY